jgi:hypothetical protein
MAVIATITELASIVALCLLLGTLIALLGLAVLS